MKASVANITSNGKRNAMRRCRTIAPENRAIAPTGVKFHGWGARRRAAARMIMPKIKMVRSMAALFSLAKSLRFICVSFFTDGTSAQAKHGLLGRAEARPYSVCGRQQVAVDEGIAFEDFAGANGNGVAEDGTV